MLSRLLLLSAMSVSALAQAAERHASVDGTGLVADIPCAASVEIQPDAGLHGQVAVSANADHQEELDQLLLDSGGGSARIHTKPGRCWSPNIFGGFERTLRLVVRVPAGFPMDIDASGAGRYTVGDVGGPLRLDVSGAGQFQIGAVTDLTADFSGASDVHIASVRGAAKVEMSGHGHVLIDSAVAPTLAADISGAGSLMITAGALGSVDVDDSGVGSVKIGAQVRDAKVDLSGVGSVRFAKLTGTLSKEVSGIGSVSVTDGPAKTAN